MENNWVSKIKEGGVIRKITILAAGAWAAIEVIAFFGERYSWPAFLVDTSIVLLVGLIALMSIFWIFNALGKFKWLKFGLVLLTILTSVYFVSHFYNRQNTIAAKVNTLAQNSILVAPFTILGDSASNEYLVAGISSSIITELTKINQLSILSEVATERYKNKKIDIAALAKEGITHVLNGKVQRIGNQVKVMSQLISTNNGVQVWADQFQGDYSDVFQLQDRISQSIARALQVKLSAEQEKKLGSRLTSNIEAYDLYLKGRFRLNSVKQADIDSAISYFIKAVQIDPDFAKAHAQLSIAYSKRNHFINDAKVNYSEKAYAEGEIALALDSTLAETYYARAYGNWLPKNGFPHQQVINDAKKALSINPRYDEAYNMLAKVFIHIGLLDEAEKALKDGNKVNPLNGDINANLCSTYYFQLRYDKMLEALPAVPEGFSKQAYYDTEHIIALLNSGKTEEATKRIDLGYKANKDILFYKVVKAVFLARENKKKEALQLLNELEAFPNKEALALTFHHVTYFMGVAYGMIGEKQKAVDWLDWTARNGFPCYPYFNTDPLLNPLREDARFVELMKRLNNEWQQFKEANQSSKN